MAYQFNHKPIGSLTGSGTYRLRHYGSEGYAITTTLTNCTGDASNPTIIEEGGTATLTFTANSGYAFPSTITVTGATYTWDSSTGTVVLSSPTSAVSITITAYQPIDVLWNNFTLDRTLTALNILYDA